MNVEFADLTDRQKRMIELRLGVNEKYPELARFPLSWMGKDRRGYGLIKAKFQGATARLIESGWVLDNVPVADFGGITVAATQRQVLTSFPLFNPAHVLGSLDPEPFELSTLAAASGDRQIGTSTQSIAILLGCYCVHITAAAGVFQPAATTLNVRVISSAAAVAGAFTTEATLVVNTATNFVDQVPITATTGRTVSITGTTLTNIAGLFNGDTLFAELVAGAAIQTNLLACIAEIV